MEARIATTLFVTTLLLMASTGASLPTLHASEPGKTGAVSALIEKHCAACHGPEKQKGKLRFDSLSSLKGDARPTC